MATVGNESSFTPLPSLMYWSRSWLECATVNRNCKAGCPLGYISGFLAAANLVTLPFTLVLDPIVGIYETLNNAKLAARDYERSNSLTGRAILLNLVDKVFVSPLRHVKVFFVSLAISSVAVPIFYLFSISSAFFFNLAYMIPNCGSYLGCAKVMWLMYFPTGWYGSWINWTFGSC